MSHRHPSYLSKSLASLPLLVFSFFLTVCLHVVFGFSLVLHASCFFIIAISFFPSRSFLFATDGSGAISQELWSSVASTSAGYQTSSGLQIRLGGIKGMLVLHPSFPREVAPRPVHLLIPQSMYKFKSQSRVSRLTSRD